MRFLLSLLTSLLSNSVWYSNPAAVFFTSLTDILVRNYVVRSTALLICESHIKNCCGSPWMIPPTGRLGRTRCSCTNVLDIECSKITNRFDQLSLNTIRNPTHPYVHNTSHHEVHASSCSGSSSIRGYSFWHQLHSAIDLLHLQGVTAKFAPSKVGVFWAYWGWWRERVTWDMLG